MAFDVYVGPLSRYMAGDWKTIGQKTVGEQEAGFVKIAPKQNLLTQFFKPKPEKLYQRFRDQISTGLTLAGFDVPEWDDSPNQEYVTDRPGWDGIVSFVAQYACACNPELTPPAMASSIPELAEDPAFRDEIKRDTSAFLEIILTRFFLPGRFDYMFGADDVMGRPAVITSIDKLDRAVNAVCEHCGFDRSELAQKPMAQLGEGATFLEAALHGTTIYAKLVNEALKRNLPLMHDY